MRVISSFLFVSAVKGFATPLRLGRTFGAAATTTTTTTSSRLFSTSNGKPFAVIVQAEIDPSRMDEFLKLIQENAENTRKEPGCLRFDVLRSKDNPNQFFFYELYTKLDDIEYHKQQPHYNLWAEFKANGGVVNSVTYKTDGEFLT